MIRWVTFLTLDPLCRSEQHFQYEYVSSGGLGVRRPTLASKFGTRKCPALGGHRFESRPPENIYKLPKFESKCYCVLNTYFNCSSYGMQSPLPFIGFWLFVRFVAIVFDASGVTEGRSSSPYRPHHHLHPHPTYTPSPTPSKPEEYTLLHTLLTSKAQ